MKFLIVGLVKNEQLERLWEEGKKRGHEVEGCYVSELVIEADGSNFKVSLRGRSMEGYDLIYLWVVGKRRWEWYVAAKYLSKKGIVIVNKKVTEEDYNYYLSPASEYLKQAKNDLFYPKSVIIFNEKSIDSVIDDFEFPVILKAGPGGRKGKTVFKLEDLEGLKKKIRELRDEGYVSFNIREFIPNDGDVRVFTVGYKAIGAMVRRAASEGEFRSNISQGGEGSEFDLEKNQEVRKLSEKISLLTRTEIAGVDIMFNKDTGKPYILEINPGPQFMGLEKYTKTNAAEEIIKYFERLVEN